MAKFKYLKKIWVDYEVDDRALDYDDKSLLGESISYILGGRENWYNKVMKLYDTELGTESAEHYIKELTAALEDTLHFQKIFTK